MNKERFELNDPRNVICKHGQFDVLIQFAWEEGDEVPTASHLSVSRLEAGAHAEIGPIRREWSSYDHAVEHVKGYAKLFADAMSKQKQL